MNKICTNFCVIVLACTNLQKYHRFCNTVYIFKVIILYFKWTANNHSDVVQFSLVVSVQISVKQDNLNVIDGILNKLKT